MLAFHKAGLIDDVRMREFEAICAASAREFLSDDNTLSDEYLGASLQQA
jgi:hypothetical protein